jgi:hypothetical protein
LAIEPRDGAWPAQWDEPFTKLLETTLWFTRRNGGPVSDFDATKSKMPADSILKTYANAAKNSCGGRIVANWISMNKNNHANDTHSAWRGSNRVLDVLRPGWTVRDDLLVIDHRDAKSGCRLELFGAGRSWLGPLWTTNAACAAISPPKPQAWVWDPSGMLAEWSYRAGEARITHSALILSGRSLALLSMLIEYRPPAPAMTGMSILLPPGIVPGPIEGSRGMILRPRTSRGSAQVLPIGLPSLPYATDRGALLKQDDALVLNQAATGRRCWLPLLVSWDAKRGRKIPHWRILSVSERSRNVAPDRAYAVRVSWGRNETYVIYRSFAKPAPRAFLGHQTTARLMVGLFNPDGVVEPILKVD